MRLPIDDGLLNGRFAIEYFMHPVWVGNQLRYSNCQFSSKSCEQKTILCCLKDHHFGMSVILSSTSSICRMPDWGAPTARFNPCAVNYQIAPGHTLFLSYVQNKKYLELINSKLSDNLTKYRNVVQFEPT